MKQKCFALAVMLVLGACTVLWAQPPDPGLDSRHSGPFASHWQTERWQRVAEYLKLAPDQQSEWQRLLQSHRDQVAARWQRLGDLRVQFRGLAAESSPDLEQLGQVALDIHREMEIARSADEDLTAALESVLTPEQLESFMSLRAARRLMRPQRGHEGRPHRRQLARPVEE